jgi:hypothetical protein
MFDEMDFSQFRQSGTIAESPLSIRVLAGLEIQFCLPNLNDVTLEENC